MFKNNAMLQEILKLKGSLLKFRLQSNKRGVKFIKKKIARLLTLINSGSKGL